MKADVLIIGARLAGLSCARTLADYEIDFLPREASEDVGGTDSDRSH